MGGNGNGKRRRLGGAWPAFGAVGCSSRGCRCECRIWWWWDVAPVGVEKNKWGRDRRSWIGRGPPVSVPSWSGGVVVGCSCSCTPWRSDARRLPAASNEKHVCHRCTLQRVLCGQVVQGRQKQPLQGYHPHTSITTTTTTQPPSIWHSTSFHCCNVPVSNRFGWSG